jgi:hypothetical protein
MSYRKVHIRWFGRPLCGLTVQDPKLIDIVEFATCRECLKVWRGKRRLRT